MLSLILNELISHTTKAFVARELNKIMGEKEKNQKKITRQLVYSWVKGHMPNPTVQDAIVCLFIRERGRSSLNKLWKKYIDKIDDKINKCNS